MGPDHRHCDRLLFAKLLQDRFIWRKNLACISHAIYKRTSRLIEKFQVSENNPIKVFI